MRVNIGCGSSPTLGEWLNYDGSPAIQLARHPWLCFCLDKAGLLNEGNRQYIWFAQQAGIRFADATKHIPLRPASVDVLYSSHMLEHLDREEAKQFLREAHRILKPGGILRIAVPDLSVMVKEYCQHGDGNRLIERTILAHSRPKRWRDKLKFLLTTDRGKHRWMYDSASLSALLTDAGFREPKAVPAGSTMIPEPGVLNLREREEESLYMEARLVKA